MVVVRVSVLLGDVLSGGAEERSARATLSARRRGCLAIEGDRRTAGTMQTSSGQVRAVGV